MKGKRCNLRNMVAIAIYLAGIAMFSGCDTKENDLYEDIAVKLISSIEVFDVENVTNYVFQYDSQNRLIAIGNYIISYPNDRTIIFSLDSSNNNPDILSSVFCATFNLNDNGNIVSADNWREQTFKYTNGYLQQTESVATDMEGNVVGTVTAKYTWKEGNIITIFENIESNYYAETTRVYKYEYVNDINKLCSIDIVRFITRREMFPPQWYGKSTMNLPSKITQQVDDGYVYIETYRYEKDDEDYVQKVYCCQDNKSEHLLCTINYQ